MYSKKIVINSTHGLPNDQVHNLAKDKFGRLWFSGPSGLSCYNGIEIKVYDTQNGLICPGLRTVTICKNDIIWLGTDRNIEALNLEGNPILLSLDFNWKYGIVETILIEENIFWLGTSFGLLKLKFDYTKSTFYFIEEFEVGLVNSMILNDNDNPIFVSANHGLLEYKKGKITPFNLEINENNKPFKILKTFDNYFLLGTSNGLYYFNDQKKILDHFIPKNISSNVKTIVCNDTLIYASFDNYLLIFEHNLSRLKVIEQHKAESSINTIYEDDYKNILLCTNNSGLQKISFLKDLITKLECGTEESSFCMYIQGDTIHVGGSGYYSILSASNNKIEPRLIKKHPINSIVWDIINDPLESEKIWLATQNGLYYLDSVNPIRDLKYNSIITSPNRVLLTRDDELWVGTIAGLFKIKNGEAIEILNQNNDKFGYVYCLSFNDDNKIWVGTLGQGLFLETNEGFKNINNNLLEKSSNTYCVKTRNKKTVVIQQEKIILLDENLNAELIYTEFPLAGWTFDWIDDDTIAAGSSDGIALIYLKTKALIKRINVYLDKSEWQFTSTRALKLNNSNSILCALNSGFYRVDLNKINDQIKLPIINLNQVKWNNVTPALKDNIYTLVEGNWSFDCSVYSTWYVDSNQIKFRFKLIGFDENWSELDQSSHIRFNSLPIGKYKLLVQSFTSLNGFGIPENILTFEIDYSWNSFLKIIYNIYNLFFNFVSTSRNKTNQLIKQNSILNKEIKNRKNAEFELINYKNKLEKIVEERTKILFLEKEKAENAEKIKSEFIANMSHEIRSPLGGIIGLNSILSETQLDEIQKEYVHKIKKTSDHLLQIINDVLDLSKIDANSLEIEKSPFSFEELLNDVAEFIYSKNFSNQVSINFIKETNFTNHVVGDSLRLKQVLFNLLTNAIKFTEKGTITLKITQLSFVDNDALLEFTISDTGIGMSPDQVKNLFKAYKQSDASISRKYGGTGLGLNISYKLVELMGGILSATSLISKGSNFTFSIPLELVNDERQSDEIIKPIDNIFDLKILIIDDDLNNSNTIKLYLKRFKIKSKIIHYNELESLNKKYNLIIINWSKEIETKYKFIIENYTTSNTKIIAIGSNNKDLQLKYNDDFKLSKVILRPFLQNHFFKTLNNIYAEIKDQNVELIDITENLKDKLIHSNYNILIAEDNSINQLVIKKIIAKENYNFKIVSNGNECIEELKNNPNYNLILMDVYMPEFDGIEATGYIRNEMNLKDLPIIALTADNSDEFANNKFKYGFDDLISKPINTLEFNEKIIKWLTK